MKPVYWRPQKMAASTTLMIGLGAVLALTIIELAPRLRTPIYQEDKLAANQLAKLCRDQIAEEREANGLRLNKLFDPTDSGLIGSAMSTITSKPASLEAKQISIHPQFPAAVVQMLRNAGVKNGDMVAVGWTGSFPGLNVALAAAIETLELRPIIIASVTASQYGANESDFTWLDMETALRDAGLIECQSLAATIGGPADCGVGMDDDALGDVRAAIERNSVRLLTAKRLSSSIKGRMRFVQRQCDSDAIAAYINVGGGVASCGGEDAVYKSGLSTSVDDTSPDCVMHRFCKRGVPVIHLAHPRSLARKCGLSQDVEAWKATTLPIGPEMAPSRIAAFLVFLGICGALHVFVLQDLGNKLVHAMIRRIQSRPVLRAVGQTEGPQLMA